MARQILDLAQDLDAIGSGVVVSFVAYLIGTVSQATLDPLLRQLPALSRRIPRAGSFQLSAKAFSSLTQFVEDRVNAVTTDLHKHGLSLKEVAERERKKDTSARAGLTDEEVARAASIRKLLREEFSEAQLVFYRETLSRFDRSDPRMGEWILEAYRTLVANEISIDELVEHGHGRPKDWVDLEMPESNARPVQHAMAVEAALAIQREMDRGLTTADLTMAAHVHKKLSVNNLLISDIDFAESVEQLMEDAARRAADWDTASLVRRVVEDLDLVATRLIGNESELYSAVDRLRAEAEFRLAIVVPIAALSVLFGALLHAYWYVTVIVSLVLLVDGIRRDRAARALVIDALFLQRVEAPALERFQQSARDVLGSSIGRGSAGSATPSYEAT